MEGLYIPSNLGTLRDPPGTAAHMEGVTRGLTREEKSEERLDRVQSGLGAWWENHH